MKSDVAPPTVAPSAIQRDQHEAPPHVSPGARALQDRAHTHDILTTAEGSGRLGTFVDYMRAAGLSNLLLGDGPFTVFAPTDKAFLKITLRGRDGLLANQRRLQAVMRGHIVAGRIPAPSAGTSSVVTTIEGNVLTVTAGNGSFHVGNARLVQTSIPATNGIIHAIDAVLLSD